MLWILSVATIVAAVWTSYAIIESRKNDKLTLGQVVTFGSVPILMIFGIGLGSYPIALNASQQDAVSGYQQFLNGSIVAANVQRYKCERDGNCRHTYKCDPYQVPRTVNDYDSKGNLVGSHTEWDTYYHDCPIVTEEFSYTLTDSIAFKGRDRVHAPPEWQHIFSAQPQKWRRSGDPIPSHVLRGIPALWQQAKDALARGDSLPVTVPDEYANFILASEKTILKAYSDKIDLLRSKQLLPEHTQSLKDPIRDVTIASKMNFVGFKPANESFWQTELMQFNAALGSTRQGDLHIVAIKASSIPASVSPQDYLNALKAYWLNGLEKYALAKNGIALVLAVDDSASTIVWSRATTGMPVGNGAMLQALSQQLAGHPFLPDTILGHTTGRVLTTGDKPKVQYTPGAGIVSQIILQEFPFERACMNCKDAEDKGKTGFVSLSSELPLDGIHTFWAVFFDLVLFALIIGGLHLLGVTRWNKRREPDLPTSRYASSDIYRAFLLDQSPRKRKKGKTHV